MKQTRTLVLRSERLADLSDDEMRGVNGAASIANVGCLVIRDPSDFLYSICECLTRNCW